MLEDAFKAIYTKFKIHFYHNISKKNQMSEDSLTTFENFCMEGILALGQPTIAQFGKLMNLSTPNAAYKVNNLIKKGYVEKIQSNEDKREYFLKPTEKYLRYHVASYSYLGNVVRAAESNFSKEDIDKLEKLLVYVGNEMIPEIDDFE